MEEVHQWESIFRTRDHTTTLVRRDFVSLQKQYHTNGDLTTKYSRNKINLDWDFKRRPVQVRNEDGCIRFTSEPWKTFDEFLEHRRAFDRWRERTNSLLKTASDWERFNAERRMPKAALMAKRTPFQQALMVELARTSRRCGRYGRGRTRAEIAQRLTDAGVQGVTKNTLAHAARREPPPTETVDVLTDDDRRTLEKLADVVSPAMVRQLLSKAAQGKTTAEEIAAIPIVVLCHAAKGPVEAFDSKSKNLTAIRKPNLAIQERGE